MQKNIIILFFIFLFPLSSIFSQFYTNRTEQELENYSKVAKILAYEFYTDETAPEKYNFAQSLAKMYESQQILQCLDSTDNQLSSLVNKTNSAITEIINSILNLKKLPMPPGELAQNIEAIIRGLIWDFRGGLKRNEEIQKQKDAILKEIHSLVDSVNKLQAYQILLPAIANKHQTTAKNKSNSLSIDFSEPWQCWGYGEKNDKDVLFLKNISGQELSKCTILVKIYGENAEVIQNVHYIEKWQSMQKLHAFYSHGENLGIENTDYLIQTLTPVRKISVSLWSNEIKEQGIEYIYSGEERKKDIKKACEKLIFKADYRPFSSGFLWDDYRGARVKMEGFSNLKNIKIIITFQEGYNIFGKSGKSFYWDVQEWEDQKIKTFATKKLDFDPSSFDIKISFSDTDYVYDVGIFRVNNK